MLCIGPGTNVDYTIKQYIKPLSLIIYLPKEIISSTQKRRKLSSQSLGKQAY